jgi:hypothetical protein
MSPVGLDDATRNGKAEATARNLTTLAAKESFEYVRLLGWINAWSVIPHPQPHPFVISLSA